MKDLPILDAEFVDLPSPVARVPKVYKPKVMKQKQAKKSKTLEGRLDVLCGGILTQYYTNMAGTPPPSPVSNTIKQAVTMLVGKQRAKGPEWDFLKSIMGG